MKLLFLKATLLLIFCGGVSSTIFAQEPFSYTASSNSINVETLHKHVEKEVIELERISPLIIETGLKKGSRSFTLEYLSRS